MISQITTACICGMQIQIIKVEILVMDGLPEVSVVGDVDSQVRESVKRVMSALKNAGVKLPGKKITVNFYPASIKKSGSHMDLAIAVSLMGAYAHIDRDAIKETAFIGEIGLSGKVLPVKGVLPIIQAVKAIGLKKCFVPFGNIKEAKLVEGIEVLGVKSLQELIEILHGSYPKFYVEKDEPIIIEETRKSDQDFKDLLGQPAVKRAAKIAAAAMHSFLMIGPPGTGKTMTANRILSILPPLSFSEQMEMTRLYSFAGMIDEKRPLINKRVLRTVTPDITARSLKGDMNRQQPGEMMLANRGILFLDELSLFSANTLEIIRQPLDEGRLSFSFGGRLVYMPARFMLVACMNACRCGAYPDMSRCTCSVSEIKRHAGRISQSFFDRFDICVHLSRIQYENISEEKCIAAGESTETMQEEVTRAFKIQQERYKNTDFITNRDLTSDAVRKYCELSYSDERLLKRTYENLQLSVRSCHSILKVARTIADLDGCDRIDTKHLVEAIGIRNIDRSFWKM